jgi:tripartite-type tricarboxylate transporter receptor subunit TctC
MAMTLGRWLWAVIAAALAPAHGAELADAYPTRSIRIIVPQAPGSAADVASRFVAERLSKALGQTIVVVNKAGAGGTIGMAELARAAPDGYTIGFASQGMLVFNQALYAKPGYDSLRDFAPIALTGRTSNVIIVHPGSPASTPADIVALAKAAPGTLTFSSGGAGTSHHMAGVLFGRMAGVDLVHVPYKGASQGVLAVMTNEVALGFFNPASVVQLIKDGKAKALGVTSLQRLPLLPSVPTLDEQGITGFEVSTWGGFVAPAGTPSEIVARLNAELIKIIAGAEARRETVLQGHDVPAPLTPAEFAAMIADDLARWVPIVKASGAKPN